MTLSARDLKVRGELCALRFVHVVVAWRMRRMRFPGVWDGVDLASPLIKRNLNICQGTIDDAVGLFKNMKCNINHT